MDITFTTGDWERNGQVICCVGFDSVKSGQLEIANFYCELMIRSSGALYARAELLELNGEGDITEFPL